MGGTWLAGVFAGDRRFHESKLGLADFGLAQNKARDWCVAQADDRDGRGAARKGSYQLRDAVEDYRAAHFANKAPPGSQSRRKSARISCRALKGWKPAS